MSVSKYSNAPLSYDNDSIYQSIPMPGRDRNFPKVELYSITHDTVCSHNETLTLQFRQNWQTQELGNLLFAYVNCTTSKFEIVDQWFIKIHLP